MKTVIYLLRHGATESNLAQPALLQGQRSDLPLAPLGVRQAEATRDLLALRPIDRCYCSPMRRAVQTAAIVASPHALTPQPIDALIECDVGRWEGKDWPTIRREEPDAFERFWADPAAHGYPGGESFAQVHSRAARAFDQFFGEHPGEVVLVVSHHAVNRAYLASLLGLPLRLARQVSLSNCGISVVCRQGAQTYVATLNADFHLQGVAA